MTSDGAPPEVAKPVEPEWPKVDVIVGNPPFLGDKKMRRRTGGQVRRGALRSLYAGRVPAWGRPGDLLVREGSDADRSREGEASRPAGDEFDSAAGRTGKCWNGSSKPMGEHLLGVGRSGRGFSTGQRFTCRLSVLTTGPRRTVRLDGKSVAEINVNLTASVDVTRRESVWENSNCVSTGHSKRGASTFHRRSRPSCCCVPTRSVRTRNR